MTTFKLSLCRAGILWAAAGAGCDVARKPAETAGPVPPAATEAALPSIPGFNPKSFGGRERAIMELADPAADKAAWASEAFSEEATAQLRALAKKLQDPRALSDESLTGIVATEFSAVALAPERLKEVFRDDLVIVRRGEAGPPAVPDKAAGDATAPFRELMQPHSGASEMHVSLKNFRIEQEAGVVTTTALFQSSGQQTAGITQQNAVWSCRWTGDSPPKLLSIAASGYELIEPAGDPDKAGGLRFADVTAAVLGGTRSAREQLTIGAGYWSGRLQKFYSIDSTAHQGIAVGDADGDGLDDIYVAQQGGLPNLLYVQNKDGTLRDVSAEAGVDWMELTHAALFVDLDNDGDQDLVLTQAIQLLIMENTGSLKFETRYHGSLAANYFSVCAADYDSDGDSDLYACGYSPQNNEEYADGARVTVPLPYHDSRNGGPNMLLRNDGSWKFTDATVAAGLNENNDRHSFAASWEDYDNDGDMDLYVANDFGRDNLYQNQGRGANGEVTFRDVAAAAGVDDISAGMGVTWGDYNRDGLMDIYVSNMFSAAGNRVTFQRQFRPGANGEILSDFRRHARGNTLFQNKGNGAFADVSVEAGVTMGRWAWGAQFADLNNDGWEDIYVTNGYITGAAHDDL
jgi:FG-GAP-like repeat